MVSKKNVFNHTAGFDPISTRPKVANVILSPSLKPKKLFLMFQGFSGAVAKMTKNVQQVLYIIMLAKV